MADFEKAFRELIEHEGGWSDLKNDPGGLTRYGISSRSYPCIDLQSLTLDGAKEIYRQDFWDKYHCGEILDQEIAEELFKAVVNTSPKAAVKALQHSANKVAGENVLDQDGVMGSKTVRIINELSAGSYGAMLLLSLFEIGLIKHYASLRGFNNFGRGWVNRVLES